MVVDGNVFIEDAIYSLNEFVPNLDVKYKKLFDDWL